MTSSYGTYLICACSGLPWDYRGGWGGTMKLPKAGMLRIPSRTHRCKIKLFNGLVCLPESTVTFLPSMVPLSTWELSLKKWNQILMSDNRHDSKYNGLYHKAEDWGGNPHWTNDNRTAHIYLWIDVNNEELVDKNVLCGSIVNGRIYSIYHCLILL